MSKNKPWIKGTTTSNGISGPELSLQKPSLRGSSRGRNKVSWLSRRKEVKEDCTGFHFFDCNTAPGRRDWPQAHDLHRKGVWIPKENNFHVKYVLVIENMQNLLHNNDKTTPPCLLVPLPKFCQCQMSPLPTLLLPLS